MATMAYGRVGPFYVVVHSSEAPTDEEWERYLDFCVRTEEARGALLRGIVFTHGGAPTVKQRRLMHDRMDMSLRQSGQTLKGAVVTTSTFVRGIVNAMNFVQPVFRGFSPADVAKAYEYIGATPSYASEIELLVASLEAELGLRPLPR